MARCRAHCRSGPSCGDTKDSEALSEVILITFVGVFGQALVPHSDDFGARRHPFLPSVLGDRNPIRCLAAQPLLDRTTASVIDRHVEIDGQPISDVAL